jgi:hypothetical protein
VEAGLGVPGQPGQSWRGPSSKNKTTKNPERARDVALVECLPIKCEALCLSARNTYTHTKTKIINNKNDLKTLG